MIANNHFKNLDSFFNQFKPIIYGKKQFIIRAEDIPQGVFFLKKGFVRQYLISQDGHELTTSIYKPYDIFPLEWVLNNKVSKYHFETMTEVTVFKASKEYFLDLIKFNPEIFFKLITRLINRIDVFSERMEYLAFGQAQQRIAALLLVFSQRFGRRTQRGILIELPLTHKDIASFLGLSRETVSIEMKKLEKKEVFLHKLHKITIKNINLLKKEAVLA
ncbi:Crp/Fnr family transcriptional regulator [Patescibacteria group bacterium]|nr:Crp/Fnr family transcriptional regulator [Patescibacteria group bacterium]